MSSTDALADCQKQLTELIHSSQPVGPTVKRIIEKYTKVGGQRRSTAELKTWALQARGSYSQTGRPKQVFDAIDKYLAEH